MTCLKKNSNNRSEKLKTVPSLSGFCNTGVRKVSLSQHSVFSGWARRGPKDILIQLAPSSLVTANNHGLFILTKHLCLKMLVRCFVNNSESECNKSMSLFRRVWTAKVKWNDYKAKYFSFIFVPSQKTNMDIKAFYGSVSL